MYPLFFDILGQPNPKKFPQNKAKNKTKTMKK